MTFTLFHQHLDDLRRVSPEAGEIFLCPICMSTIPRENVDRETVNIGHVWPKFLRESAGTESTRGHQVLLCKPCNSSAGSRGDQEMQIYERTRRGELPSKMFIMSHDGRNPITIPVYFKRLNSSEGVRYQIKTQVPRGEWNHNDRWRRYRDLSDTKSRFSAAINPNPHNWQLAQAGWLTSAYLFAFYTFGYRYVLQTELDQVRNYIKRSFTGNVDDSLAPAPAKNLSVQTCEYCNYLEPEIAYVMKTIGTEEPHHLEVSFLDYHIRLPLPLQFPIGIPADLFNDPKMKLVQSAVGHIPHEGKCSWEETLNDPDYSVIGGKILISRSRL